MIKEDYVLISHGYFIINWLNGQTAQQFKESWNKTEGEEVYLKP